MEYQYDFYNQYKCREKQNFSINNIKIQKIGETKILTQEFIFKKETLNKVMILVHLPM